MKIRYMVTAMIAMGLGSVVSAPVSACAVSALETASNSARADAFAQFAGGIKAAQQGRSGTARASGPANMYVPAAHGSIVGFWKFAFTAPDGVTGVDWGFQQWHDDGTELTNSGNVLPATGNWCSGVWEQHGAGAYSLNHWAIAWNPPGTDPSDFVGLINIRETVSVDKTGNSMTGTFGLDLYAPDGTTFVTHLVDGTVSGARITP